MSNKKWGIAELFAGTVGVSQGFVEQGHFKLLAISDVDKDAKDTFVENFPKYRKGYLIKDVRELKGNDLRDAAGGNKIDGLLGCPPCQGFSPAGKRNPRDERNQLMSDYVRLIRELHPRFFVL